MWRGALTIAEGRAAYSGPAGDSTAHRHVALQIVHDGGLPVAVETARGLTTGPVLLIAPMVRHRLLARDHAEVVFIEPQSTLGRALLARHAAEVTVLDALPDLTQVGERFSAIDPRLAAALALLETVSVREAAAAVGLSPQRLGAIARAQLGVPPARWLLWEKLGRAAMALAQGAPLAGAAARGGFADQAHFTRTLRTMFGITPGALKGQGRRAA
jgi:AraC-like DNA-binding protein